VATLDRALTLPEVDNLPLAVTKDLNLNVVGLFNKLLHKDLRFRMNKCTDDESVVWQLLHAAASTTP
jgi:hypothetical protein